MTVTIKTSYENKMNGCAGVAAEMELNEGMNSFNQQYKHLSMTVRGQYTKECSGVQGGFEPILLAQHHPFAEEFVENDKQGEDKKSDNEHFSRCGFHRSVYRTRVFLNGGGDLADSGIITA